MGNKKTRADSDKNRIINPAAAKQAPIQQNIQIDDRNAPEHRMAQKRLSKLQMKRMLPRPRHSAAGAFHSEQGTPNAWNMQNQLQRQQNQISCGKQQLLPRM